jgi:acyl-CoA thioesterase I
MSGVANLGWIAALTLASVAMASGPASSGVPSPSRSAVPPAVVYALGDSTVSGVGARSGSYVDKLFSRLVKAGYRLRLVNLAESGASTADLLRDQVPQVPMKQNALVIVGVGVNDLTSGVAPEVFARRFESLLRGLRSRTSGPIVVSNLPDISLAPAVWAAARAPLAAQVDIYNGLMARIAGRLGIVVYDICAMTRRTLPSHPEYLSGDGYHPSDAGYQVWADGLWSIVRPLI